MPKPIKGTVTVDEDGTITVTDPNLIKLLHDNYHAQMNQGKPDAKEKTRGFPVKFEALDGNATHQVNSLCAC